MKPKKNPSVIKNKPYELSSLIVFHALSKMRRSTLWYIDWLLWNCCDPLISFSETTTHVLPETKKWPWINAKISPNGFKILIFTAYFTWVGADCIEYIKLWLIIFSSISYAVCRKQFYCFCITLIRLNSSVSWFIYHWRLHSGATGALNSFLQIAFILSIIAFLQCCQRISYIISAHSALFLEQNGLKRRWDLNPGKTYPDRFKILRWAKQWSYIMFQNGVEWPHVFIYFLPIW